VGGTLRKLGLLSEVVTKLSMGEFALEDGGIARCEFGVSGSGFRDVSLFAVSVGSLRVVKSSGGWWCGEA
jgi:hypothetical protein